MTRARDVPPAAPIGFCNIESGVCLPLPGDGSGVKSAVDPPAAPVRLLPPADTRRSPSQRRGDVGQQPIDLGDEFDDRAQLDCLTGSSSNAQHAVTSEQGRSPGPQDHRREGR
jgi:hypothetical protein